MAWAERHGKGWRARWKGPPGTKPEYPSEPGFPTKLAARRYGEDQEAAIRAGTYIDPAAAETPLAEWWETWLPAQDLRLNTVIAYKQQWNRHIGPRWGATPLKGIRGIDMQTWLKALRDETGLSASTLNIITSALSGCLESAASPANRMIGHSPMPPRQARKRKSAASAPPREGVVIPLAVIEQILARMPTDADRLFVLIAALTGMRWSEIAGMRTADLHLEPARDGQSAAGYYRIDPRLGALHQDEHARPYFGAPKSGSQTALAPGFKPGRIIELPAFLVLILLAYLETLPATKDGLLFPGKFGQPRRYEAFSVGAWRPACDGRPAYVSPKGRSVREALPSVWPDLQFHDLKHTHAAILNDLHVHPVMRDYRLGHVSPGTPGIYSHPTAAMRAEMIDALEAFGQAWLTGGLASAWPGWRSPRPTPILLPPARTNGSGDNALF